MTGFADQVAQGILNHITGKSAIFSIPTAYIALFTAVGIDSGAGFTEVSGGSYARFTTSAANWNSASGSAPSVITNATALTFPVATANWGTIIAWGIYDMLTHGNLLAWDYIGPFQWLPTEITAASPAVFLTALHGYSIGDSVVFSLEYGGTAPIFSASNFTGLLRITHLNSNTFSVTNNGFPVDTSRAGSGFVRKVASIQVSTGQLWTFPPATISISVA